MANRHKVQKRNVGGAVVSYGKPKVISAARSKSEGFKSGGAIPGAKGAGRLDKRARGGRTGGSPFSSARTSEKGNLTSKGGTKTRP